MKTSMTRADAIATAINDAIATYGADSENVAVLTAIQNSLAKAHTPSPSEIAKREQNEALADRLYLALRNADRSLSVAEMRTDIPICDGLSSAKVNAIVGMLLTQGRVERVDAHRKYFYTAI